jgi:trehalose-6-phosphate synthase
VGRSRRLQAGAAFATEVAPTKRYLERHRDRRTSLTYLQIAPVSRGNVAKYRELHAELEQIAGHINGTHSSADWTRCATSTATSPTPP